MDHLANLAANAKVLPGRAIILSSSFAGSPRAMFQNYQNAMAICRKYGKPDLFVTMTCNPNWREITQSLSPNQTASDRPDLVAKVFKIELFRLLKNINVNHIFRKVVAYTWTIELQKSGLPHCHMLFILSEGYKPRDAEIVDKIVCFDIPDPQACPILHARATNFMMHGPCGTINSSAPCMRSEDNVCSKQFSMGYSL